MKAKKKKKLILTTCLKNWLPYCGNNDLFQSTLFSSQYKRRAYYYV